MELETKNIVLPHYRRNGDAVVRRGDDVFRVSGHFVVGMDEIDIGMGRQAFHHFVGPVDDELIPPHVGHLQLPFRETDDAARKESQGFDVPVFFGLFVEGLHTEADARQFLALFTSSRMRSVRP